MSENNGWGEYKREVMFRLGHIERHLNEIENKVDRVQNSVVALKTKAGVIGGIVAFLASVGVSLAVKYL